MKVFWSNCLIEAVKEKIKYPHRIEMKFILTMWHFHVMWFDKKDNIIRHFTHKHTDDTQSDLWFKGMIEEISISQFNNFCEKKNKLNLMIEVN